MSRILVAGIDKIDKERFSSPSEPWKNPCYCDMTYLNKPNGCLWGSTFTPNDTYMSDWLRWVFGEEFHVEKYRHAISFTLKKKARICTIDNFDDYLKVMKKYSKPRLYGYGNEKAIDFSALSKDYDAFHLTENAFWSMRLPWYPLEDIDGNRLADFYSYDCESWVLFNLECINEGSVMNHSIPKIY